MAHFKDKVVRFLRTNALVLMAVTYALFVIAGAAALMFLERPEEKLLVRKLRELKTRFLTDHPCVDEAALDRLLGRVLSAGRRGVAALESRADERNFDLTSSLFFVTTFLTTTGYGSTAPLSDGGRVFSLLYALLGIPLTLLLLSSITRALLPHVTRGPARSLQVCWGVSGGQAALLQCAVLSFSTGALFFILPAGLLCRIHGHWSFLQALYFCFTSLSTTGLTDFLPTRTRSPAARQGLELVTSCYLMLGLVVLLLVVESFWELPQVQEVLRFLAGPRVSELVGLDLDELVSDGEDPHYTLPISTISPTTHLTLDLHSFPSSREKTQKLELSVE